MAAKTGDGVREQSPPAPPLIIGQLDRILASVPFRTSKRCSDLLKYVVHAVCDGRSEQLKERTLGVAVFDRDPDYDTNQDPVVRTTAGQVRKRLAQYYLESGHDEELRIDLPSGAYVPQIYQPQTREPVRAAQAFIPAEPVQAQRTFPLSKRLWFTAAGVGMVALSVALTLTIRNARNEVDRFWAPVLRQPGPIVLCVGQGHTYKLKGGFDRFFDPEQEFGNPGAAPPAIPLNDILPIWDRAIGINDAQTLVRFTALFAGRGRTVEFRGGRSTSLGDLRGRPVVLIGAFNNSWTLSLTGELRFYFDDDTAAKSYLVRDRQHPQNRTWEVHSDQDPAQDHEDYAIVSRVFNPTTEQPVIVAAGIQGGGTAAAGEFLTNTGYLSKTLESAPPNWDHRNVQFVLKTRLLSGTAGPPQVVAAYYW